MPDAASGRTETRLEDGSARQRWLRLLARGDRLIGLLRFPSLPGQLDNRLSPDSTVKIAMYRVLFGPNAIAWLAMLTVLPIIYVGFGLTVSVSGWGWPQNLYPWIDNDYWWHLASGNWMIDKREMPTPDPWLFTYDGKFVAHEWLGEIFLSFTDRVDGYQASVVATWLIAIAGFWFLLGAAHLYGLSWRACLVVTVLWMGVFLREGVFAPRPQMWTFSFYALFFVLIALYETGRVRHLWLLPPLFLLWFNVHLSAVIGIVAFGLFGLDQIIRHKPVRHLLVTGVLSLAGLIVNPFGLDYVDQIFRFGGRPDVWNERIFEWQAPVLSQSHNWGFVLSIPMVVPAAWQLLRGRVWPAGLVLVFAYQAYNSVRFVTPYVIFCVVFVGWLVWQYRSDVQDAAVPVTRPKGQSLWWLAVPAFVASLLVFWVATDFDNSQFRNDPYAWGYPVEAATVYLDNYADQRLFNTYDWGGYLDLRFNGNPEIFIDGRADTYPDALIEQYFHMVDGRNGWDVMMNDYDIGVIMIRPIDGLNLALDVHPGWSLVYQDEWANLYVRNSDF